MHLSLNEEKLFADAASRALENYELPAWDTNGVHPISNQAFVRHNFWWNTVNFAFSLFDGTNEDGTLRKFIVRRSDGVEMSGAFAMASCFYRAFGENKILAQDMRPWVESKEAMERFFEGETKIPLIGERRRLLTEACEILELEFAGDPWNIWEAGKFLSYGTQDSPGIADLLRLRFPQTFGLDSTVWATEDGDRHPFYFDKRAHLVTLMYHGRAEKSSGDLPLIGDIHKLGPVPDYELPRSYVEDGIFVYSDGLTGRIKDGVLIESESEEELEIRGATVWAQVMELVVINDERRKRGISPLHIGHVDYYRWLRGRKNKNLNHHLCKTTNY